MHPTFTHSILRFRFKRNRSSPHRPFEWVERCISSTLFARFVGDSEFRSVEPHCGEWTHEHEKRMEAFCYFFQTLFCRRQYKNFNDNNLFMTTRMQIHTFFVDRAVAFVEWCQKMPQFLRLDHRMALVTDEERRYVISISILILSGMRGLPTNSGLLLNLVICL